MLTQNELDKISEIITISAKYPSNYALKTLASNVQRFIQNSKGTGSRFQVHKPGQNNILAPKEKTIAEIIKENRPTLEEAKEIRQELIENPTEKPKKFRKSNKYKTENPDND